MKGTRISFAHSLRRAARRLAWRRPELFFLFGWLVLGRAAMRRNYTCWLDGYPRSGNTFAAHALAACLPEGFSLRTHTHQAALILSAVRRGKPGIFVIRAPRECASSWALFAGKPVGELLDYYIDFHRVLLPYRDRMLVAPFDEITHDLGRVFERFSARFGVPCKPFIHTAENADRIFSSLEGNQRRARGSVDELTIWRPSAERDVLKAQLSRELDSSPALLEKLREAESLFGAFVPGALKPAPLAGTAAVAEVREPRLLILTPTSRVSPFLDATIESIRAVAFQKHACLICPESQLEILRRRYPDFRVIASPGRDASLHAALDAGLADVSEPWDWFTYLNDGDLFAPGFAEMARRHCRPENMGVIGYGNVTLIDRAGAPLGRMTVEANPDHFGALLHGGVSPIGQQGMLFGAPVVRALGAFRDEYEACADLDFWARAYALGYQFRYHRLDIARFRLPPLQPLPEAALALREHREIARRCHPQPVSNLAVRRAVWAYRLRNAPRYIERWRALGVFATSHHLLANAGASRAQQPGPEPAKRVSLAAPIVK